MARHLGNFADYSGLLLFIQKSTPRFSVNTVLVRLENGYKVIV